jgi:CTP-dependent riboflavin kinase
MYEGLKESSFFTQLSWVREQLITKLDIDPYPGTLNLDIIDSEDVKKLKEIKKQKGVEIIPAEPGFCSAKCFHVLVCEKIIVNGSFLWRPTMWPFVTLLMSDGIFAGVKRVKKALIPAPQQLLTIYL